MRIVNPINLSRKWSNLCLHLMFYMMSPCKRLHELYVIDEVITHILQRKWENADCRMSYYSTWQLYVLQTYQENIHNDNSNNYKGDNSVEIFCAFVYILLSINSFLIKCSLLNHQMPNQPYIVIKSI